MEPTETPAEPATKNRFRWLTVESLATAQASSQESWERHRDSMQSSTDELVGIQALVELVNSPLVAQARRAFDGSFWKVEIRLVAGGAFSASHEKLAQAARRCGVSAGVWSAS